MKKTRKNNIRKCRLLFSHAFIDIFVRNIILMLIAKNVNILLLVNLVFASRISKKATIRVSSYQYIG